MIAAAKQPVLSAVPLNCQEKFMTLLPLIQRYAHLAFRRARAERREELIHQVIVNAYAALVRLTMRSRSDAAHASTLARYAIRQVRSGRCLGVCLNIRDPLNYSCQRAKGIRLQSLNNSEGADWRDALVEDRHAGPAETASARIDFSTWLDTLPQPKRAIALALVEGERTEEVARQFCRSEGRISQIRHELQRSWYAFHCPTVAKRKTKTTSVNV
jgi:hypothetical protein